MNDDLSGYYLAPVGATPAAAPPPASGVLDWSQQQVPTSTLSNLQQVTKIVAVGTQFSGGQDEVAAAAKLGFSRTARSLQSLNLRNSNATGEWFYQAERRQMQDPSMSVEVSSHLAVDLCLGAFLAACFFPLCILPPSYGHFAYVYLFKCSAMTRTPGLLCVMRALTNSVVLGRQTAPDTTLARQWTMDFFIGMLHVCVSSNRQRGACVQDVQREEFCLHNVLGRENM